MRYFEDFEVGDVFTLPPIEVRQDDIIDFARQYDPQPMHTDPAAAAASPFGGLIASGWHTCALAMRAFAEWFRAEDVRSLGSPGLDEVRWIAPVRPGDRLSGRFEVTARRRSNSKPMGLITQRLEFCNQHGKLVLRMIGTGLYALKPEAVP